MEQVYVFHLAYYDQSASNGQQQLLMNHNQHARSKEEVIDVMANNYDSALYEAKKEYLKRNPCFVFVDTRPIRVIHWENA